MQSVSCVCWATQCAKKSGPTLKVVAHPRDKYLGFCIWYGTHDHTLQGAVSLHSDLTMQDSLYIYLGELMVKLTAIPKAMLHKIALHLQLN